MYKILFYTPFPAFLKILGGIKKIIAINVVESKQFKQRWSLQDPNKRALASAMRTYSVPPFLTTPTIWSCSSPLFSGRISHQSNRIQRPKSGLLVRLLQKTKKKKTSLLVAVAIRCNLLLARRTLIPPVQTRHG